MPASFLTVRQEPANLLESIHPDTHVARSGVQGGRRCAAAEVPQLPAGHRKGLVPADRETTVIGSSAEAASATARQCLPMDIETRLPRRWKESVRIDGAFEPNSCELGPGCSRTEGASTRNVPSGMSATIKICCWSVGCLGLPVWVVLPQSLLLSGKWTAAATKILLTRRHPNSSVFVETKETISRACRQCSLSLFIPGLPGNSDTVNSLAGPLYAPFACPVSKQP